VNPAKAIGRYPELGTLSIGAAADIAVLELNSGVFVFIDSMRKKLTGAKKLEGVMTLRNGKVLFDRDGRMSPASGETSRLAPVVSYPREESRAMEGSAIYDLVLKQGQVIDPGNKRYGRYDIAINGRKIAKIAKWVAAAQARLAVDASEYFVTPGLIDVNADVNYIDSTSGVQPDQHSLPYGVTNLADPKATSAVIRRSRTQVLAVGAPAGMTGLITSGMNRQTVLAGQASMTRTMSLLLNEGIAFPELVEGATVRPARAIGHEELGVLREGGAADIAMFEIKRGDFALVDNKGRRLAAKARIVCVLTIRNGDVVWDLHGLSIREWTQAGRYTSYR
jgi:predicted amidohydrolase